MPFARADMILDASFHAASYPFPWAGYDEVLDEIVDRAALVNGPSRVLELGSGSGNLTARFSLEGHAVHALDRDAPSLNMLEERIPGVSVTCLDFLTPRWFEPFAEQPPFHRVVSSYALRELDLAQTLTLIEQVFDHLLGRKGAMIIGDNAFATRALCEDGKNSWGADWPDSWRCLIVDETIEALVARGFKVSHKLVGPCACVLRLTRKKR